MVTNIAVPELRRYAPDALRMLGIPLGQADETAEMLVWTEAVVGGALRFVQSNRARLLWNPRPRVRVLAETAEEVVIDARGGSLLELGVRINDFACAEALARGSRRVRVKNVYGAVFLPYLTAAAAARGVRLLADWHEVSEPPAAVRDPRASLTLDASLLPHDCPSTGLNTDAYLRAIDRGIDLDDDDFASVIQLFEMLRVPTSERSRTHAG